MKVVESEEWVKYILGDENFADEIMFCPNCKAVIEYESGKIFNYYCPSCGNKLPIPEKEVK